MCDAVVALPDATRLGRVVFGKNSDRPASDCQVLHFQPGGPQGPGGTIRCSYVTLPQAGTVLGTLGCRPYWCWGYETGMNEVGVVGGNTAIYTRSLQLDQGPPGLTGMDLLRLGLERGTTAEEAVDVITRLLERYGQWGSAVPGQTHRQGSYDNAFLIADRREAWVLETSGRRWVAERVGEGVRSLSNEPTIRTRWTRASEDLAEFARDQGWWEPDQGELDFALVYGDHRGYSRQVSHIRCMRTRGLLDQGLGTLDVRTVMGILRDHYEGTFLGGPQFHPFLPDFHTVCMHDSPAGFTWGNTATSFVVELTPEDPEPPPAWVCYLPPCSSVYAAYPFGAPLPDPASRPGTAGLGVRTADGAPEDGFREDSLWWRFHRLIEAIQDDPEARRLRAREVFDPLEERRLARVAQAMTLGPQERGRALGDLVEEQLAETLQALDLLEHEWGREAAPAAVRTES